MKKKIAIIVQARFGSKRLPGKISKKLKGKSLLFRIVQRLTKSKLAGKIIVVMPNKKRERNISKSITFKKVKFFFGPEKNVLKRYYLACVKYNIDTIVRFPGDNAIPDPEEIDRIISFYCKFNKPFFASNIQSFYNNNYPDGIGAEVFSFKHLNELIKKKLSNKKKEHVHLNFFNYKKEKVINSRWCKVRTIRCPRKKSFKNVRLDINYNKDYQFIKNIYDNLYSDKKMFTTQEVFKFLKLKKENEKKSFF